MLDISNIYRNIKLFLVWICLIFITLIALWKLLTLPPAITILLGYQPKGDCPRCIYQTLPARIGTFFFHVTFIAGAVVSWKFYYRKLFFPTFATAIYILMLIVCNIIPAFFR